MSAVNGTNGHKASTKEVNVGEQDEYNAEAREADALWAELLGGRRFDNKPWHEVLLGGGERQPGTDRPITFIPESPYVPPKGGGFW